MEWKEVIATDYCYKVADGTHDSPKRQNRGRFLITSKHIKGPSIDFDNAYYISEDDYQKIIKRSKIDKWDVIVSMIGEYCGFCYLEDSDFTDYAVKNVGILKVGERIKSLWLYYYLNSPDGRNQLKNTRAGSSQPYISLGSLRNLLIPEPPRDIMERTVSILSSLDRKIELNNKINADLEEMAQAIFKNWFVDFEPFKDGKFVDSELGMIPEGWKVISLNEILDNVSGYSYKGSELQSSNIAMATIKNFERKGGFKTEGYKEIVISKKIKETQFVNMFDVLVAHTDLTQNAEIVGNPAIVLSKGGYEKLIMSMDLTKVISKIDGVTNGLLYCILSTSRFKEHALGYVNGTTVLHMSKKAVPEYTCAFPKDINQIRDLCITLDSIYKRMAVTYDENSRLSTLRDTLLPRLMSGEIEVLE